MQNQLNAIALAYEAALEPAKWPEALSAIAKAGNAKGACMVLVETSSKDLYSFNKFSDTHSTEDFIGYMTKHSTYESDLWAAAVDYLKKSPEFSTVSKEQLIEIKQRLFSANAQNDSIEILGIHSRLGLLLNRNAPWEDGLALQYDTDITSYPNEARKSLTAIGPYLARAASLIRPVHVLEAEHGAMLDVLEKLAIGVAVVSSTGTLILKNASFEKILDLNTLFLDPNKRLRAANTNVDAKLQQSINGTSKMSVGLDLNQGEFISLPVQDRANPISLEISPLGRKGKDSPIKGWSIIFAVDPHWRLTTDTQKLGQSYELTSVEEDICALLLEGLTNREISDVRSCGLETVKTHVSNLLTKTWTKNRTELARLAAVAELPLID